MNGIGAILILVTCISGVILWWPGRQRWWPRMTMRLSSRGPRFLRELHNVVGFWLFALVFLWALTGVYFAFPSVFHGLSDLARGSASDYADNAVSLFIEDSIAWLVRLHFGRSFGMFVKVSWVILGLAPCILFVTGLLMWWRRRAHLSQIRQFDDALRARGGRDAMTVTNERCARRVASSRGSTA